MKFFITLVILISWESEVITQEDSASALEQRIAKAVEAWRVGADPRLPPADPLTLPPFSSTYQQFGIKVTLATSEIQLRGLKDMVIKELHVSKDTMQGSFLLSVPLISLHADKYEANGRAYVIIRVNCAGKANIKINDADIRLNTQLATVQGRLILKDLSLNLTFSGVQASLEGCNQNIVSLVNKNAESILRQRQDDIAALFKQILDTVIEKLD